MEPNRIDFKTGKFIANGVNYTIVDYIPVGRDVRYTNLIPQMAFGTDFKGIFSFARKIYDHATTGNDPLLALHKIATDSMNFMESIKNVGESGHPIYYELAAIFCNRDGEDPAMLTDQMVKEKIDDWEKSGIPREDFFQLAISSIQGLAKAWKALQEEVAGIKQQMSQE